MPSAFSHTSVARSALALGILLAMAPPADAQTAPGSRHHWELLLSSGALVPTGAQRHAVKDAQLSTAQLSYVVRSRFALTTMLGWARSRDRSAVGDPKLDVFTFDVGAEARAARHTVREGMTIRPFVGAGAGSRSYNHRHLERDATHNVAGYAAVGGELGFSRVRVRLEVRDYLTGFKPLACNGAAGTRNDVVALVGLRLTRAGA